MSTTHRPLLDIVAGQFENPQFSDLIVRCADRTWNIHKVIVCSRSDFFLKACTGRFKEGHEAIITLPDDEGCVVHEMLRYIYTSEYKDDHCYPHAVDFDEGDNHVGIEPCCFKPMLFNVHMHTIADKFLLPDLMQLANKKFAGHCKSASLHFDDFSDAIEEMYTTAAHSKTVMQSAAVDAAFHHAHELYSEDRGDAFREMASGTPEFASQLAAMMVSKGLPQINLSRWPLAPMSIRVRSPSGDITRLSINPQDNIPTIKQRIAGKEGFPEGKPLLKFKGRWLHDDRKAMDYGIEDGDTLEVRLLETPGQICSK